MARYRFSRPYAGGMGTWGKGHDAELTEEEASYLMERFPGLITPLAPLTTMPEHSETARTATGGATRVMGKRSGGLRGRR